MRTLLAVLVTALSLVAACDGGDKTTVTGSVTTDDTTSDATEDTVPDTTPDVTATDTTSDATEDTVPNVCPHKEYVEGEVWACKELENGALHRLKVTPQCGLDCSSFSVESFILNEDGTIEMFIDGWKLICEVAHSA